MPDEVKPTEEKSVRGWWADSRAVILPLLTTLAAAVIGSVLTYLGVPPRIVNTVTEVIKTVPIQQPEPDGGYSPTGGWVYDADAIARNLDPAQTEQFDTTPAGRAVLGDEDVFLWRAVRKAAGLKDNEYPNVNQGSVGCCVGAGWKHCCDVVQGTAIALGKMFDWKPIAVEPIYAGSRNEVGGGRISGDGSIGAWAKEWCQTRGGLIAMQKYDAADLTQFSPARAREWGRKGVPDALEPDAKLHPIRGCALVKSWAEGKKAIQQGYPIAVCSDQGFSMQRDATGRARPQGSWAHCMAIIGVRAAKDGRSEGGFVLNSWGDTAHTGPVWPADAPVAGFWADASVIDRMLRQGDSFALSDVAGFPARRPDWFVRVEPRRAELFLSEFALAP
jgi:hypothetical protein